MKIRRREAAAINPHLNCYSPLLQRIYSTRGITHAEELDKRMQSLQNYSSLKGLDIACQRLKHAITQQQRIVIVGDFDADGATSTALAVSALKSMGAKYVDYLVPNRFEYGYGLSPEIVKVAKEEKNPQLIITVDNGISSIEGVDTANGLGIDVIVTDHHLPPEILPKACAIVNPNQLGDFFPSKSVAGVGVIFYVMAALRRNLKDCNWFESQQIIEPNMAQFLDLVALGTVADVVALDKNNRILVDQGLSRIRQGLCRPGIKALIKIAGRNIEQLRESDLGFSIAPRLNAAGRLDDMSHGIECLLCESDSLALSMASELDTLNIERRKIETEMKIQALEALDKIHKNVENNALAIPLALCLFDITWHQGVIGILAGRLKEKYHRPVIVFSKVSENELKGSARSIPNLNIRDVLAAVDKDNPGLINKFGGHAMAAGLSITPSSFSSFKEALEKEVSKSINIEDCVGEVLSDGPLKVQEINLETANELRNGGPWGSSFPEPVFDDIFEILDQRIVGQNHLKLTLMHRDGCEPLDAIAFNVDLNSWPNHRASHAHFAYRLDINTFQGRTKLQLMISTMQVTESCVSNFLTEEIM